MTPQGLDDARDILMKGWLLRTALDSASKCELPPSFQMRLKECFQHCAPRYTLHERVRYCLSAVRAEDASVPYFFVASEREILERLLAETEL